MSKVTNYLSIDEHVSGQKFYWKEGNIFGRPKAYQLPGGAKQVIMMDMPELDANGETVMKGDKPVLKHRKGDIVDAAPVTRFQMKVRGTTDFVSLDSLTSTQLGIITGKQFTAENAALLRGATVIYTVSTREQGKTYYRRIDDTRALVAPRSGEFTEVSEIEFANEEAVDMLPDFQSTGNSSDFAARSLANAQALVKTLK